MFRSSTSKRIEGERKRAISHPLRNRILEIYTREPRRSLSVEGLTAAVAETWEDGEVSPAEVRYHRDCLRDAELLPS